MNPRSNIQHPARLNVVTLFACIWACIATPLHSAPTLTTDRILQKARSHWAFQPLKFDLPPPNSNSGYQGQNEIDRFTSAKLQTATLSPSPEADRRTLLRRLSYDLIGLPPTPAEVAAFQNDPSPNAYQKQVDRLLNSPHFGERQTRHWLDIIRFAESDGFERNAPRNNAWRYRDWVIHALNQDLPYNEFVQLQIAGDILHPNNPLAVTATGFLGCGPYDVIGNDLGTESMRKLTRQTQLGELVGTVTQTFLGLTVECARCHDHKYNPISQKEYFQVAAALGGVASGNRNNYEGTLSPETSTTLVSISKRIHQLEERFVEECRTIGGTLAQRYAPQPIDDSTKSPPYHQLVLEDEPLGFWRLDESATEPIARNLGTLGDQINGTYNEGVKHQLPSLTRDTANTAIELAPNGIVSIPPFDKLRGGTGFTVEFLIQLASSSNGGYMNIVGDGESGDDFYLMVYLGAGGLVRAHLNTEKGIRAVDSTASLPPDKIVHVASTWNASTGQLDLYFNGTRTTTTTSIGFLPDSSKPRHTDNPLYFGADRRGSPAPRVILDEVAIYNKPLPPERILAHARAVGKTTSIGTDWSDLLENLSPKAADQLDGLLTIQRDLSAHRLLKQLATRSPTHGVTPRQPELFHVLARGDFNKPGDVVSAGGLAALGLAPNRTSAHSFNLKPDAPEAQRRVKLAEWMTHPENPLTARVAVNRLWQNHFGTGLVTTPNDFGENGTKPSHPQLLDWLATQLINGGWKQKTIHRLIVNSVTYRQQSLPRPDGIRLDPGNQLLWRFTPRRLEAEILRDSLLVAAGRLNPQMGGPSYRDFELEKKGEAHTYFPKASTQRFQRRSIYRMWARSGTTPFLAAFNCPNTSVRTPHRTITTTPLQALALLNSSLVDRQSEALADRVQRKHPNDETAQLHEIYQLIFQRDPSPPEESDAKPFVTEHGLQHFCVVLFNSSEFVYVD